MKMERLHSACCHLTVILSVMFIVFLVLDQFNPMMNFIDNNISRWLLAGLCLSGAFQSVLHWGLSGPGKRGRQED